MATSLDFIEFVCQQIQGVGDIRFRKMFGEYMIYVNDKPALLVCDNTVYVKMLPELQDKMAQAETGHPYEGAKEHYILDIDNASFSQEIAALLAEVLPLPKPKQKTKKSDGGSGGS